MATIEEASQQSGSSDKAAGLIAAISMISGDQQYSFELYKRLVLPIDGFVFWVKASELPNYIGNPNVGALYRRTVFGSNVFNALNKQAEPTPAQLQMYEFSTNGSLHLTQELAQEQDTTYVSQTIAFTTKTQITQFERIAPDEMYIVTIPNGSQVAFGNQNNRYSLAGLWHYHGKAVYSTLATQIVNDINTINVNSQIVSNSLPFWLALGTQNVPVYPSFLSPKNLTPPYITADITQTESLGQAPVYNKTFSQSQLVSDIIDFTMFGLNNDAALDFQWAVLQNSENGDYGIMNMPVPVDEKTNQVEFQIIAQKKTMRVQVDYYQDRARNFARKYITQALFKLTPIPHIFPVPIIV